MPINKKVIRTAGFTLIEMLLVMVIVSTILFMGLGYIQQRTEALRIDKATLQMQQILNASLAYYVNKGEWPQSGIGGASTPDSLMGTNYIPPISPFNSPWGIVYYGMSTPTNFYVVAGIVGTGAAVNAQVLAGRLGLSYTTATAPTTAPVVTAPPAKTTCPAGSATCYVVASVTIPGQNLNNANAVNYAGLYRNGACVQVPVCPSGTTPQIFVVPAAVAGANDRNNPNDIYPLNSFTAYATGIGVGGGPNPQHCSNKPAGESYVSRDSDCFLTGPGQSGTKITTGDYWRVCLNVMTQRGTVNWDNGISDNSGQYAGTVMAVTRCAISNENDKNSAFNVFSR